MIGHIFHSTIALPPLKEGGYRYGFNGMEREDEHSQGKYDFGARINNKRGRPLIKNCFNNVE